MNSLKQKEEREVLDLQIKMPKDDFLNTLTPDQRYGVEFLLDEAFANGYSEGFMNGKIACEYDQQYFS